MTKTIRIAAIAALLAVTATPTHAAVEVNLTVDDKSIDPEKDQPPDLLAKIVAGTAPPPLEKIVLVQTDPKKGEITIAASELKTYVEGDETLGVAVVFYTHWLWLGNESWWSKDRSKTPGYHKELATAIDKLVAAGPAGSRAALISYGAGARKRWEGELKELTGARMGSQKELTTTGDPPTEDFPDGIPVVGKAIAAGLDEAISALNKMGVSRKVLIVVGDGSFTDDVGDYKKKLQQDDIACYAIGVPAILADQLKPDPTGNGKICGSGAKWLDSAEGLPAAMGSIVDDLADRYYVRFPGADIKLKKSFEWDENPHSFAIRGISKKDVELADDVVLTPKWVPPWMRQKKSSGLWWKILLGVLGALILIIAAVAILGRKKAAPPPEPVVVAPPPVAAPAPAPAPAGPMKTVMIGVGGDDQGFPIVGWIVPLNGPNQFQTFKLQPGATKIGTGGGSHIVINDGFMSTEHAQIVMSPAGFTLVDGGSTNGTLVNERRVDKHELVDNDTFLMGKTNFRFKSIN